MKPYFNDKTINDKQFFNKANDIKGYRVSLPHIEIHSKRRGGDACITSLTSLLIESKYG